MITEIATILVNPEGGAGIAAAFAQARPIIEGAKGCRGAALRRCVEHPERFMLTVQWDTLEDHMVTFRESDLFTRWRALMGPHFAAPPEVVHYAEL